MQQRKSNKGLATELQLVCWSPEEARYFPGTVHGGARDEDAELSSREAFIQAVLNSDTEALDAVRDPSATSTAV